MIAVQVLGVVLLPAFAIAAMPQGWLWRAVLLWFGVPLAAWVGILMLGVPNTPHGADAVGRNLYNLAFLFPLLAIPFLALTGVVLGLGLVLRRLLGPLMGRLMGRQPRSATPKCAGAPEVTFRGDPVSRVLSPDGRIAVDMAPMEWYNSHWIHAPRVTDLATGRQLLDLHGRDWDSTVDFPGPGQAVLGLHGHGSRASLALELDLGAGTCRIRTGPAPRDAWPPAPLAAAATQIEAAVARFEAAEAAQRPIPIAPNRFAAWRTAVLILVLALLAIGGLSYIWVANGWAPPPSPRALLRSLLP